MASSSFAQDSTRLQNNSIKKSEKIEEYIRVNKLVHDFGDVNEGINAECDFIIENISTDPIVIDRAYFSYSGDSPQWDKNPIFPNKKRIIKVIYHTMGRPGHFSKTLYIRTNVGELNFIFKGTVIQMKD